LLTRSRKERAGLWRVMRNLFEWGGWLQLAEAIVAGAESRLISRLKMALQASCEA
jgi:hypothetical protein